MREAGSGRPWPRGGWRWCVAVFGFKRWGEICRGFKQEWDGGFFRYTFGVVCLPGIVIYNGYFGGMDSAAS